MAKRNQRRNRFASKYGRATVKIVPRDEMDLEKLSLALVEIAQDLPKEQQDKLAQEGAEISKRLNLFKSRKAA